jgi:hypothetical protein
MSDTAPEVKVDPPTEPGFYHFDGGAQRMVFLLTAPGNGSQWYTMFDNGVTDVCGWDYIQQALSVYNLVKLESKESSND